MIRQSQQVNPANMSHPRRIDRPSSAVNRLLKAALDSRRRARDRGLDRETVHDLRVACRRAEAALRLCRDEGRRDDARWIGKQLKKFRQACNAARDDDVLAQQMERIDTPSASAMSQFLKHGRKRAIKPIEQLLRKGRRWKEIERRSQRLVRSLQSSDRNRSLRPCIGARLLCEVRRVVSRFATRPDDDAGLHKLRIATKRLRYACEFAMCACSDVHFDDTVAFLKTLQKRLGMLHDYAIGEHRLRKVRTKGPIRVSRELSELTQKSFKMVQQDFSSWWRATSIERIFADATREVIKLMRQSDSRYCANASRIVARGR
jgi:CHAD domain-containing protein